MTGLPIAYLNMAFKTLTIALAVFPLIAPDLPQFQDKFLGVRSGLYPPIMLIVPAIWYLRRRPSPYPHLFDIALVMPFVLDMTANAANLYNTFDDTDGIAHFIITMTTVITGGMVMVELTLPKWAVGALAIGFGATVHTLWELFEYALFKMGAFGLDLSYDDTIQDLAMGLIGTAIATAIVLRFLWDAHLVPPWLLPRRVARRSHEATPAPNG